MNTQKLLALLQDPRILPTDEFCGNILGNIVIFRNGAHIGYIDCTTEEIDIF